MKKGGNSGNAPRVAASLIITTYNWKEALELVLRSAFGQTCLPLEIVVADDGSRPDTASLIRRLTPESPVPLVHVWQEDKGYRLAKNRNQGLVQTQGDYILLIDGDIVLHPRFVADHLAVARPGWFVQGPRALLNAEVTHRSMVAGRLRIPHTLGGIGNKKNCVRSEWLSRMFSWESRTMRSIRLCNFAFWKEDAFRVNGFNEEFEGWGREDSEFVARLFNSGVRRKNLKFRALGYHLHHPMNARNRLAYNDELLQRTIDGRLVWCEKGLNLHHTPSAGPV